MRQVLFVCLAAIGQSGQPCQSCQPCPTGTCITTTSQDDLDRAVKSLEEQIRNLCQSMQRQPILASPTSTADYLRNATGLSDLMADSLPLTRSYMALAIAELKLWEARGKVDGYLVQHADVTQIAIDTRPFDETDRRVYLTLQAAVRESLRQDVSGFRGSSGCNGFPQVAIHCLPTGKTCTRTCACVAPRTNRRCGLGKVCR